MNKQRALFLCTGNSARSQMAEGLTNYFVGDRWEAFSAGTEPAGYVHPLAVQAMDEMGIDISLQRSKSVDEFRDGEFDVVITLCDGAAKNCPLWLGAGRVTHLGFPDPAAAAGSADEQMEVFRRVRNRLSQEVLHYLGKLENSTMKKEFYATGNL